MQLSRRKANRHRGGFQPPHCPNPRCDFHLSRSDWPFKRDGLYIRPSDHQCFQAFECLHCGRNFSARTFSPTYWLRYRNLLRRMASWACEGPCLRQMGRVYGISHSTVARHLARIGRHCLIFHHNLLQDTTLDEPLVVDGFETFEFSQYFPFHINFAAGSDSWLLYHFTDSPLRRKGSMTPGQKMRRAELEELFGRPDPKAAEKGMAYLLRPLLERVKVGQELVLHSDDHPAYRRALQRLVRHSSANHRRETIAFSKRRQAALERAAIFTVWSKVKTVTMGDRQTCHACRYAF